MLWLVRLLLPVLALACAHDTATPTRSERTADYLYVRRGDQPDTAERDPKAAGGVSQLYVDVEPNPKGRAPVRFAESTASGVGEAWRATVWMSLFASAALLEREPETLRITVEAEGTVDGPSAGALMAAAIVAAHRGLELDPEATLTAALNPDFSLGPVGGVPEKVEAALDAGKKRIGVAVGQGGATSRRTGQVVDVISLARSRGAEVVELSSVGDAVAFLTRNPAPAVPALERDEMVPPTWVKEHFSARAERLAERLGTSLPALEGAAPRRAPELLKLARSHLAAGESIAALWLALEAQRLVLETETRVAARLGATSGEWAAVRQGLLRRQQEVEHGLEALMPRWKEGAPERPTDVPLLVEAFDGLVTALRGIGQGRAATEMYPALGRLLTRRGYVPPPGEVRELLEGVGELAVGLAFAQVRLDASSAWLELRRELDRREGRVPGVALPDAVLSEVAGQYERVADANLGYLDALLVQPAAAQLEMTVERVRARIAAQDPDFRLAFMSRALSGRLEGGPLGPREARYAALSGAVSSYFASASVISKRYSLDAEFEGEVVVAIGHRAAFDSMQILAERTAREVAARCQHELGEVPLTALVEHHSGRALEQLAMGAKGALELALRLEALGHYWRASMHGRLALSTHRRL